MQESFSMSAGRHLQDAQILLTQHRWDNAVYLSGYVVECSFKFLVEQYFKQHSRATSEAKDFGHKLTKLEEQATISVERAGEIYNSIIPKLVLDGLIRSQDI